LGRHTAAIDPSAKESSLTPAPARRWTAPWTVGGGSQAGHRVQASGSIPVIFADYDIANPSFGPVTTGDSGQIESLLAFTRG
jgi:hypothetical protein